VDDISGKIDTAQIDLDNPDQYKANVSGLATSVALATAQADLDNPSQYKADVSNLDIAVSSRLASSDITLTTGKVTVGSNTDKTGYSLSVTGIDAIWDETQLGHTSAGTFGKYLDSEISEVIASVSDGDKDDIVDKVWDELQTDHTIVGTFGKYLDAQVSISGDDAATIWAYGSRILTELDEDNTTIDLDGTTVGGLTTWDKTGYTLSGAGIDNIWDELQAGHTTVGSFGLNLDAAISTRAQPSDVEIYVGQ